MPPYDKTRVEKKKNPLCDIIKCYFKDLVLASPRKP